MKPEEYSWNEWEQNRYINGDVKVPSEYKIKVTDIPPEEDGVRNAP